MLKSDTMSYLTVLYCQFSLYYTFRQDHWHHGCLQDFFPGLKNEGIWRTQVPQYGTGSVPRSPPEADIFADNICNTKSTLHHLQGCQCPSFLAHACGRPWLSHDLSKRTRRSPPSSLLRLNTRCIVRSMIHLGRLHICRSSFTGMQQSPSTRSEFILIDLLLTTYVDSVIVGAWRREVLGPSDKGRGLFDVKLRRSLSPLWSLYCHR